MSGKIIPLPEDQMFSSIAPNSNVFTSPYSSNKKPTIESTDYNNTKNTSNSKKDEGFLNKISKEIEPIVKDERFIELSKERKKLEEEYKKYEQTADSLSTEKQHAIRDGGNSRSKLPGIEEKIKKNGAKLSEIGTRLKQIEVEQ